MSKRIMDEVMTTAEEHDIKIFYTDTDSMHIQESGIEKLESEFELKYNRKLVGANLGQFHCDFDFKSAYHIAPKDGKTQLHRVGDSVPKSKTEPVAIESYFVGKKSYIDHIIDGNGNEAYHIRAKGISGQVLLNVCNTPNNINYPTNETPGQLTPGPLIPTDFKSNPIELFKALYNGASVDFPLGVGGNLMFQIGKDHTVSSGEMTRSVCFKKIIKKKVLKRKFEYNSDEHSDEDEHSDMLTDD
jgi:hypothetical protein